MASSETPPVSLRHGVRLVPQPTSTVEQLLLAVGEQVGHGNISYASRMNKAVVVFFKEQKFVRELIESGVTLNEEFIQVSPLAVTSTRITMSGVPPFIPNEALERELRRFGKFASAFRSVSLGCKDVKLKHVQSLRRQVLMFLDAPMQTLDVSFRVKHEEGFYMVYASSGSVKCFECGDAGHKRISCPHRQCNDSGGGSVPVDPPMCGGAAALSGGPAGGPAGAPSGSPAAVGSGGPAGGPARAPGGGSAAVGDDSPAAVTSSGTSSGSTAVIQKNDLKEKNCEIKTKNVVSGDEDAGETEQVRETGKGNRAGLSSGWWSEDGPAGRSK